MNPIPPVDEQLLLDYVYGLLESEDVARVDEFLLTDAAWQSAHAEMKQFGSLLARASVGDFSTVTFTAPEQNLNQTQKTLNEVKTQTADKYDPEHGVGYGIWVRYVITASLFLAVCALGAPTLRDVLGFAYYRPGMAKHVQELEKFNAEKEARNQELIAADTKAREMVAAERAKVEKIFNDWLVAARKERELLTSLAFSVTVKGPVSAVPGRANEYVLIVGRRPSRDPEPDLTAEVKNDAGQVLYRTTLPGSPSPQDGRPVERKFTVPANIWNKVSATSGLTLDVLSKDPKTGELKSVRAPVNLFEPLFTTFLTTDRPLYKPSESIYFRALTLERTRLLPPDQEQTYQFELIGPGGNRVSGVMPIIGLNRLVHDDPSPVTPVLGPDGKPIRGVASGVFNLPNSLPGGEYKLIMTEATPSGFAPPNARPVAVRRFTIAGYHPDRFIKTLTFDASSYGPGETVQATLNVRDQIRSISSARVLVKLEADGKVINLPEVRTDNAGNASMSLPLPKDTDLTKVVLTLTVQSTGIVESVVRPVPIRTAKLKVEFFPEGGELILGVPNRVYFRVTNAMGQPADLTANLTDGTKTLTQIQTLTDAEHPGVNQGNGVFEFTPEAGKSYKLELLKPKGVTEPKGGYTLPKAVASGVAMRVEAQSNPGEPIKLQLHNQGAKRTLVVGAYVRGRPMVHQRLSLEPNTNKLVSLDLGDSQLGGVTRVTVFEEVAGKDDLVPLAERLVYRRTKQVLNLKINGMNPPGQAYQPNDVVNLTVQATNEKGESVGAILWASAVNQSVLSQANDRTERLLPTHFLLNGEVENGDTLEEADFLLTEHPKAALGLDLLLGTQGWRKFTAAPPKTGPSDPFLAINSRSLTPSVSTRIRTRPALKSVFEDYWPKYEAAATTLDELEKRYTRGELTRSESEALQLAEGKASSQTNVLNSAAQDLWFFQRRLEVRLSWLPATLFVLGSYGILMIVSVFMTKSGSPLRRSLVRALFGLIALLVLATLAASLPWMVSNRWQSYAPTVAQHNEYDRWGRYGGRKQYSGVGSTTPPLGAAMQVPDRQVPNAVAGPDRLPAELAPFALGMDEQAGPDQDQLQPAAIGGRRPNMFMAAPQPQQAPVNAAATRLLSTIRWLSDADKSAFLGVPQMPPLVVRQYAYTPANREFAQPNRSTFQDTLLWQPVLVTQPNEAAKLQFSISDQLNSYRLMVAGHTLDGRLGASTATIEVRKPLAIEPKLPLEISSTDKLQVPLVLLNSNKFSENVTLSTTLNGFKTSDPLKQSVEAPTGSMRKLLNVEPTLQDGQGLVTLSLNNANRLLDSVTRAVKVVPDGFPIQGNKTERLEGRASITASLPACIEGTLKASVTIYPNTLAELQGGLDGLLREPHGCFEQASSANYPNVLVLDYLREQGRANSEVAGRARDFLQRGYSKLTSYECPKTGAPSRIGYEWFGAADRQHEALTAYGLLQFSDMARVYNVDDEMLQRTKRFLLDSRDGKGGFRRASTSLDRFGSAPDHITSAYIVWAITESEKAGERSDLKVELDALLKQSQAANHAKDAYFLALVGNALHNAGRPKEALDLFKKLGALQAKDGSVTGSTTSITRSTGRDLLIEATALSVLGWMKADQFAEFGTRIPEAISWLNQQRGPSGAFGSTQSTILALKAVVAYARQNKHPLESAEIRVRVGGRQITTTGFRSDSATPTVIDIPTPDLLLRPGDNFIEIETNARQSYPLAVVWSGRTLQPRNSPDCPLNLEAKLSQEKVNEGDSVRLDVTLTNRQAKTQGMAVAVIGLPAGLKLPDDHQELKQLALTPKDGSEAVLSHWEINGRELVLYWRGLTENQQVKLNLTLIANIPGEYRGPASRAYLYYGADYKQWIAPLKITISPRGS